MYIINQNSDTSTKRSHLFVIILSLIYFKLELGSSTKT